MASIKVYPLKQSSLNIKHPVAGVLAPAGSLWPGDGFTFRMLASNLVTKDQAKSWKPEAPAPAPAQQQTATQ